MHRLLALRRILEYSLLLKDALVAANDEDPITAVVLAPIVAAITAAIEGRDGQTVDDVDLDEEDGTLAWKVELDRENGEDGAEVKIDAKTGDVIEVEEG